MFKLFVLAAFVAVVFADQEPIPIVKQDAESNFDGSYSNSYETGNGISAEEHGFVGGGAEGSFKYTDPDGKLIEISYKADENGFQPQGDHLPQSPEIPEPIARALKWIEAHPEKEQ